MRSQKPLQLLLAAFAVTAFAACGGDGPGITDPDPDPVPVDTAAVNAAARVAATNVLLAQMEDAMEAINATASTGGVPTVMAPVEAGAAMRANAAGAPPPPPDAAKCTFDEETVRHNCPNFTQANGIVIKTWFQFLDAQGAPHRHPDTTKTVAIKRYIEKSGTTQTVHNGTIPATTTMLNKDTLTLSGLKGPPAGRKLNGTGTMDVALVPEGQASVSIKVTTTTENFAFVPPPPPPEKPTVRYPISGKVTAIVTSQRSDMPQAGSTTTQVTTYDGSKIAKLVISLANGTVLRTCTWDMTATLPPVCTMP